MVISSTNDTSRVTMEKLIVITWLLLAVFSNIQCDSNEDASKAVVKKLISKNKEHIDEGLAKIEEHCPGATDKLKEAVKSFLQCDDKVDDSLTICQQIQTAALNCTTPLLKVVEDCLPATARGLPTLGLKSLISAADYLCKQTGESIFELANPCLWEDEEESNEDDECEKKANTFIDKHFKNEDDFPSKTEICTLATSLRSCTQTQLNTACKNQKTKDIAIGVYDALIAPCSHINET